MKSIIPPPMNKITHLMPCSQFVIEAAKKIHSDNRKLHSDLCLNYAKFLQRPLTLPDLVPCVNGVPISKNPEEFEAHLRNTRDGGWWEEYTKYRDDYNAAKANCLFEGFEVVMPRANGFYRAKSKNLEFTFDQYGCFLEAYHSCDGQRINSIERLTQLNISGYLPLTSKSIELIYGR